MITRSGENKTQHPEAVIHPEYCLLLRLRSVIGSGLLIALLAGLVTSCSNSGGDQAPRYVVSEPVMLVLRPGESDLARTSSSDPDALLEPFWSNGFGTALSDSQQDCSLAVETCARQLISRQAVEQPGFPISKLIWPFSAEDGEYGLKSYIPVNLFPQTPDSLPPVIQFSAGGSTVNPADVTNENLSDGWLIHSQGAVALTADGRVWQWGNFQSVFTEGSIFDPDQAAPVAVAGLEQMTAVAAGRAFALALKDDGSVWQLGDMHNDWVDPRQVNGLSGIVALAAGGGHALALDQNGAVWSWGENDENQLGRSQASYGFDTTPRVVDGLSGIVKIAAGRRHSLALDSDGKLWAWGDYRHGQTVPVADISNIQPQKPQQVRFFDSTVIVDIDAEGDNSLVLRDDGKVWVWGDNSSAQLGVNASGLEMSDQPVAINTAAGDFGTVVQASLGGGFGTALLNDGSVWAWGDNRFGQVAGLPGLANGEPRRIQSLSGVTRISAGGHLALARVDDCNLGNAVSGGRLVAWGDNTFGSRGDGTGVNWLRPTPVLGLGDDATCSNVRGYRLIIYKSGLGGGSIQSDYVPGVGSGIEPGLHCTGLMCWQNVENGATVNLTASPDADSQFGAWLWDCADSNSVIQTQMTGVKYCKLRFDPIQDATPATLDITVSGAGRIVSQPLGIDCGSQCSASFSTGAGITLTATADTGWHFSGWSGDCSGLADSTSLALNGNRQCGADFTPDNPQSLSVLVLGQGSVIETASHFVCSPESTETQKLCTADFEAGQILTLLPRPAPGYHWNSWGNCTENLGQSGCIVKLSGNQYGQVIGEFLADNVSTGPTMTHHLTLYVVGNGLVTSAPAGIECTGECGADFDEGTVVTLDAAGSNGDQTIRWFGDCAQDSATYSSTVTMDADRYCSVSFSSGTNSLTVSVTGNGTVVSDIPGIDCGADCYEAYQQGQGVGLSAIADSGWLFDSWSGDCVFFASNPAYAVATTNRDVTCDATFVTPTNPVTLTVQIMGNGGAVNEAIAGFSCSHASGAATTTCSTTYSSGMDLVLVADTTSRTDWWQGCDSYIPVDPLSNKENCALQISADTTVILELR